MVSPTNSIEMASSNVSFSAPMILVPTENVASLNDGPAVTVKPLSQTHKSFNFMESLNLILRTVRQEAINLFTFHPEEWFNAFKRNPKFPLFVAGDIDGFVALFMNNLATLLAVIVGLTLVFDKDIIYGKIVPG